MSRKSAYARAYHAFLQSEEWEVVRQRILRRSEGRCELCGMEAEVVHHLTYAAGWAPPDRFLLATCTACHCKLHGRRHHLAWDGTDHTDHWQS